jgi:hypothetical protein
VALDECDPVTFNASTRAGPEFCKTVALGASTALWDLLTKAAAGTPDPKWDFRTRQSDHQSVVRSDFMNERQPSRSAGICIALMLALLAVAAINSAPAECAAPAATPTVSVLATGLQGAFGSTVGPDGALYVAESAAGRISRINPRTGQITAFASGLPKTIPAVGVGGATDVVFVGNTMYVLVTLVSPDVGGSSVDGIYRLDGPNHFTVVANIGDFNERNPPTISFPFFVKSGVLFAMKPYRKGFLVTDGHLNRMLQVTPGGQISILIAFDDIVPTGLTVQNATIYMAEAGPVPHLPQNGKVVAFKPGSEEVTEVASGASLLVGVKFGPDGKPYALSQGPGVPGAPAGSPAQPNSGALVRANGDGTFTFIVDELNLPVSFNFIGGTAYVVTLTGDVLKISGVQQ